jgi:methylaspartate mutase sigma subunit
MPTKIKATLITGTIGDDVHSLGIRVLEHAFKNAGFKVVALGIQTTREDFVKAAIETNADAILISSLSGHARMLCPGLREMCLEAGLKDILLYIGGWLTTGDATWEETERLFKEMGYNRAYSGDALPGQVIVDLETDLGIKPKSRK